MTEFIWRRGRSVDLKLDLPPDELVALVEERLAPLMKNGQLEKHEQRPALIPVLGSQLACHISQWRAGADVRIALVAPDKYSALKAGGAAVNPSLTYGPEIAGTDLLYDITGERMQGKARPFVCDLAKFPIRVYAILPFQMEMVAVAAQQRVSRAPLVSVQFQDASQTRIQGALPFHWSLTRVNADTNANEGRSNAPSQVASAFASTNRDGEFQDRLPFPGGAAPGQWRLAIRSCLTGEEVSLPIELVSADAPALNVKLTTENITRRIHPQPVFNQPRHS